MSKAKERPLVILGAGASIEYGIPATIKFTDIIEAAVMSDPWVQSQGGDAAYQTIKRRLKRYLHNPGIVLRTRADIHSAGSCRGSAALAAVHTPAPAERFLPVDRTAR